MGEISEQLGEGLIWKQKGPLTGRSHHGAPVGSQQDIADLIAHSSLETFTYNETLTTDADNRFK